MARRAAGLTATKVRTAKPGRYGDGAGLYLLVRSPELKFWILRWVRGGRMREMGLGPASGNGAVTLASARGKAAELWRQLREGLDPLAERDAQRAAAKALAQRTAAQGMTFRQVADKYLAAHESGWRNAKHASQWSNTLRDYAFPHFGDLPVAEIATGHVMAALEPIWTEKPETASRIRGRIESVLDYARSRGWREGENPARWRGHIENLLPRRSKIQKVEHHAALPWQEMGCFISLLREQDGIGALALEFAILTAARTGEVIGARWGEFDLRGKMWTVPAERMKGGKEHRVPLAPRALGILKELVKLRRTDNPAEFVFPGGKPGRPLSNMALLMVLRRMERPDLTVHGFRSTFRDWCAESTNYPNEVAEMALAHAVGDKVEAAYRRGALFEKRERLMADWERFSGQRSVRGEVVPMRGRDGQS